MNEKFQKVYYKQAGKGLNSLGTLVGNGTNPSGFDVSPYKYNGDSIMPITMTCRAQD